MYVIQFTTPYIYLVKINILNMKIIFIPIILQNYKETIFLFQKGKIFIIDGDMVS